ncbi:MAG: hypothetical protein QXG48_02155 [Thermofilaceae archaeon]
MTNVIGTGVTALREFARRCLAAGGVPQFRTKYGGRPLPDNSVIVACWGAANRVPGGTIRNVPPDIIARLERQTGDWKWLIGETPLR